MKKKRLQHISSGSSIDMQHPELWLLQAHLGLDMQIRRPFGGGCQSFFFDNDFTEMVSNDEADQHWRREDE